MKSIVILLKSLWREVVRDQLPKECLDIYKNDRRHRVNHLLVKLTYTHRNRDISTLISISYTIITIKKAIVTIKVRLDLLMTIPLGSHRSMAIINRMMIIQAVDIC